MSLSLVGFLTTKSFEDWVTRPNVVPPSLKLNKKLYSNNLKLKLFF